MRISISISVLASCVLLAAVLANWSVTHNVELFNWGAWTSEQQQLSKKASRLTSTLSKTINSYPAEQGNAVRQAPRRPAPALPARRKTIPMDQALAMLKVQDQMRHEAKFSKDRVDSAGDVAGMVSERDERDMDRALGDAHLRPTKAARLFENCKDGSATVEDAELCQRRADAIRTLTRAAVRSQLAERRRRAAAPALAAAAAADAEARRELLAEAMRGGRCANRRGQRFAR